ncbi:MAG TPA: septum formation initiator family protein [Candidatus Obscuribacterales bacterium]
MKIALALVFVYLLVNCINLVNQEMRLQNYQARLDQDIQHVRKEQSKLKGDLKYYNTSEGVEELARKRLGYYKQGEIPLRVIESATPQNPSPKTEQSTEYSESSRGAGAVEAPTIEITGPTQPL